MIACDGTTLIAAAAAAAAHIVHCWCGVMALL